jgi:chemotaxis protein CheX
MKAEILNAFLTSCANTINKETQQPVTRRGLLLEPTDQVADEVTVYVALVGQVRGVVLVGMSNETARQIASIMVGEQLPELNDMGLSAIAELGNLITGGACMELEKYGYGSDITPPTLMMGGRSRLSTLGLPRFVIPLQVKFGQINIHVAVDVKST